jgi:hypothetical protein
MEYNGKGHSGQIDNGEWLVEGARFNSPSAAAGGVTRTRAGKTPSLDGWIYWQSDLVTPGGFPSTRCAASRPKTWREQELTPTADVPAAHGVITTGAASSEFVVPAYYGITGNMRQRTVQAASPAPC